MQPGNVKAINWKPYNLTQKYHKLKTTDNNSMVFKLISKGVYNIQQQNFLVCALIIFRVAMIIHIY